MNFPLYYAAIDAGMIKGFADNNQQPTCCKGCFSCCREPVFATRRHVEYLLEPFTEDQRATLRINVQVWLDKFLAEGLDKLPMKGLAHPYRARFLWCPLLAKDGTCSVYERRPLECRLHAAIGPKKFCDDDTLRRDQVFVGVPKVVEWSAQQAVATLEIGASEIHDHFVIMLAEALGIHVHATACRARLTKHSETDLTWEVNRPFAKHEETTP